MTYKITIPSRLNSILEQDSALVGKVHTSIEPFSNIISYNKLFFFPEYTDHGPQHVQDVLGTASSLITDEAWSVITPHDVAVLILAIVLHDAGMHLTEDGFLSLLKQNNDSSLIKDIDDKLWPDLWQEFLSEASRFDGQKLFELFGSSEAITKPPSDPNKWIKKDILLIGEFLRRHHARLAHEIAIFGMPGPSKKTIKLKGFSKEVASLIGIVARSHGLPLRKSIEFIEIKYTDIREYQKIHAVYLMALLRIADYMQVQSERAPEEFLKIQSLRSPISRNEWNAHISVKDIRHTHMDPESIFIESNPDSAKTYLRMQRLLKDMQTELDMSWAVLGEVYGRWDGLNKLELTIRRIRSNLDDVVTFSKTVNYIPCHAKFQAADADLLKLLIQPLYGDSPEIGIRELLQNAVDAVRELEEYTRNRSDLSKIEFGSQNSDVEITLSRKSDDRWFVTISDRGIGMTADTIVNYFLKAGASFRRSDQWREMFEVEGDSRVLRAGRFGVGILAAFLIGNEIEVTTRHVNEVKENGIMFSASIESNEIDLKKVSCPVGTTIRIQIGKNQLKALEKIEKGWNFDTGNYEYNWFSNSIRFYLLYPSVTFKNKAQKIETLPPKILPQSLSNLPLNWRRISHSDYQDIHYTYDYDFPSLVCNGIEINETHVYEWRNRKSEQDEQLVFMRPSISVFDQNAKLPLNLTRNDLVSEALPFERELLDDIAKDFGAFYLAKSPTEFNIAKIIELNLKYPGLDTRRFGFSYAMKQTPSYLILPNSGISLADPWCLKSLGITNIMVASNSELNDLDKIKCLKFTDACPILALDRSYSSTVFLRAILSLALIEDIGIGGLVLLSTTRAKSIMQGKIIAGHMLETVYETVLDQDFTIWEFGKRIRGLVDFEKIVIGISDSNELNYCPDIAELYFPKQIEISDQSVPAAAWEKYIGQPVIPFDLKVRKKKLAKSYKLLAKHLKYWEEPKKSKATKRAKTKKS